MGIFSRRRQRLIDDAAAAILPQVQQLLASIPQAKAIDLDRALETALVKSVESAGASQEKTASILFGFMDRAADMAFRRSRSPGGRARAKTAKRQGGRFIRNCRLCKNPSLPNPTVEEIFEHAKHDSEVLDVEVLNNRVVAHVNEDAVQEVNGEERIECDGCEVPPQKQLH